MREAVRIDSPNLTGFHTHTLSDSHSLGHNSGSHSSTREIRHEGGWPACWMAAAAQQSSLKAVSRGLVTYK